MKGGALWPRAYAAVWALGLYIALWGGICSMAYLSDTALAPLSAGGLWLLVMSLWPEGRRRSAALAGAGALLTAALALARPGAVPDGAKLFLDRLFLQSQARQSYLYELFSVPRTADMRGALLCAGLLSGTLCGLAARLRSRLLPAALFSLWALAAAWLGLSPSALWTLLAAAALGLCFAARPGARCLAVLLPLGLAALLALVLFPGEDEALSGWEERARDALAVETAAYAERREAEALARERQRETARREFFRRERFDADTGGEEKDWKRPLSLLLAILLFALILFVPAICSDRRKRRRARAREGLDAPAPAQAVYAAFLYAMRWLRLAGLPERNLPWSARGEEIGERFSPELRASFERVLPVWQEAAYSSHPLGEPARAEMRTFLREAEREAWNALGRRERLRAKWAMGMEPETNKRDQRKGVGNL